MSDSGNGRRKPGTVLINGEEVAWSEIGGYLLKKFGGVVAKYGAKADASFGSTLEAVGSVRMGAFASTVYHFEAFDKDGNLKWEETVPNIVVNTGLDDLLDKRFKASAFTSSDFVGLTDGTPTIAAGDTMASHAGWVEVTDYSEGTREALTLGSIASQSVDNSASKASFSINATVTVGGAFVNTDGTKGGSTGILYGVAALTEGDRSLVNGDTLNVTVTLTTAAS